MIKLFLLLFSLNIINNGAFAGEGDNCARNEAYICTTRSCTCQALKIDQLSGVSFGRFVTPSAGGLITVLPSGGYNVSGNITVLGGNFSAAKFRVSGPAKTKFRVILPVESELNSRGVRAQMRDLRLDNTEGVYTIEDSGYVDVAVGATLNVPPRLQMGAFDGSFSFDVEIIR